MAGGTLNKLWQKCVLPAEATPRMEAFNFSNQFDGKTSLIFVS